AAENPEITPADVEAAAKLSGRAYTPEERALMARRAARTRENLRALRAATLPETAAPAVVFEPCLPGTRLPSGKSRCQMSRGSAPAYDGNPESLAFATVVELSRLLRAGKVTSLELTRMYLGRLKRFGPRLKCVVTLTE